MQANQRRRRRAVCPPRLSESRANCDCCTHVRCCAVLARRRALLGPTRWRFARCNEQLCAEKVAHTHAHTNLGLIVVWPPSSGHSCACDSVPPPPPPPPPAHIAQQCESERTELTSRTVEAGRVCADGSRCYEATHATSGGADSRRRRPFPSVAQYRRPIATTKPFELLWAPSLPIYCCACVRSLRDVKSGESRRLAS
jgi:hypothetical protein